jgi:MFS family permease
MTSSIGNSRPFVIGAVIGIAAVFAMALGLTYPLLAIILEGQGVSSTMIGLNTAMTPLGIIITAPFIPWVARRFGAWRVAFTCALITALLFFAIGTWRNVWFWFPLRLLLGASIDSLFVVSETWLLQLAGRHHRGRLVGLYGTSLAVGFTIGPFVLSVTGSEGWAAFGTGIAVMLLTTAGLLMVRGKVPEQTGSQKASLGEFARLAPFLLVAVGVIACFDQVALSMLPVYLLNFGMNESRAAIAIGVLVVGNVLLQYPIGWLSDRVPRRRVMLACLLLVLACSVALHYTLGSVLLWPVLFVLGSSGFGIYTVVLAELGDRFDGAMLLAGNAAFALMWGVGGFVGPPVTGSVMDLVGSVGLPLSLIAVFTLLLVALLVSRPRT